MIGALILLPLFLRIFNPSFIYKSRGMKNTVTKNDPVQEESVDIQGGGDVIDACKEQRVSL
jgi:hypothetical protein